MSSGDKARYDDAVKISKGKAPGDKAAAGVIIREVEAKALKEGSNICAKCKKVHYCGKDCQRKDWKSGHKEICGTDKDDELFFFSK